METPVNLLVSKVLETLFNMAKEELAMQLSLVDDVKTLQNTLERLQCYFQDSEKKNIEDDSPKRWLNQINHAMYDIEDLLDEYGALKDNNRESMSNEEDNSSSSSSTEVRFCFPVKRSFFKKVASRHRIGVELRRLNKQLNDDIKGQIPELSFKINFAPTGPVESQITSNNRTTAVVVRSDIVGNEIQDDARRLIELLTKVDDRDNPLVYAIVGMGGIGKTTLAKLVFNDHIIASRFQVNVWVSVSQNYNENDILRNIITSAGGDGERCHNFNSLSQKVKDTVKGKRLFMVLDDVWETKRVWNDTLRILLKRGVAEGSRVLVTTTNEEVAAQMMAVHSQRVQPLPLDDGWSLLCKSAFPAWEQQEAKDDKWNLKDIGKELVKKCDWTTASDQCRRRDVVRPDQNKRIMGVCSQGQYVGVTKTCLQISSGVSCIDPLFPKGEYFNIMNAKNLWIQEGLIKDETNISSHDVAERYFTILVQRNLVILDRVYIEAAYFRMHDLVYSLSQFLTRNENLVATEEKEILNSGFDGKIKNLRRLSFIGGPHKTTNIQKKCLQEQVSLTTLLTFDKTICNIDNDLFNHLCHLRILWLRGTKVTKLPANLGSLKLLRYLNLSQTPIKELPKTIQNLKALRILDVSECKNLSNLPSCIMKLHHMCSPTTKGSTLDDLPPGVGNLNKLQHLEFIVPLDQDIARESSTVKELEILTELRRLNLYKLERVLDSSQAKSASLKDKLHLEELELSCSERDSNEVSREDSDRIEEVFEDLRPPVRIKILKICNYFGCKLPSWLGSRLFHIRFLKISRCSNCNKLDGLGLLPNLEALYIEGAASIKRIGSKFYTNSRENDAYQNSVFFPKMKLLSFENMDSWEEWRSLGNSIRVMPHLEILQIYACPKLKSIPKGVLFHAANSLKRIRICKAPQLLLKKLHNLRSLEIIEIGNIPYLEKISGVPALRRLKIEDCPGINLVELTHTLQNIDWKDFNADSLPMWFSTDGHGNDNIKATYLQISCKEELVRKICSNDVHECKKIQQFDNITVLDKNERLRLTRSERPNSFTRYDGQMEAVIESISKVVGTLINMAKEELAMQLRLVDDVQTLRGTLVLIQSYLQDFEKKNIKEVSMEQWLDQINHAMYDIEDLLEDYGALKDNTSESKSNEEDKSSSSSSTKVRFCFPVKLSSFMKVASNHRIGVELRRLNKQLNNDINGQIPRLSLLTNFAPTRRVKRQRTSNHKDIAVVVRSDIVGNRIQDDARRLIELLTKVDDRDNPLVYAIVGMRGIGKTTLAKLVFDDHIIASRFQVNVWVSVSQNYNETDILRNIITSAGGDGERCHDFNSLSEKVKDAVEGKRLFMVLDDVWETKIVWNDTLRILLKRGVAEGSRVLVTTTNEEVAAQMMAVHSQRVQPLPLEDGWSLLCKSAFPAWEQQAAKDDKWNLKDIGIELVKRCDGLPLAINVIGGMLSDRTKTRESWEYVLKDSMWEVKGLPKEIHSVLYISYQDLPTNIKRCFLYCSLFPKGEYFNIMNAKNLWIQEGLIKDETNISSHDVAERYFTILIQRNLVILDRVYIEAAYFKMHDLVYSLSQFLARNENLVATEEKEILNSEFDGKIKKLRRLSFLGGPHETTNIQKKCMQEQVSLRTLLIFDKTIYNIDNDLFYHLRHLRILWLRGTKVTELPASLGSLRLLRYLNLSQTPIKELPVEIKNLNALRILDVSECKNLSNLPSCLMKLHHMCSLTTKGSALDHLPPGVGNLNKLQLLEFIVPLDQEIARESSTVKELETLTELRRLNLYKLERVLDSSQAKSASLKDKRRLEELELSCSERDSNEVSREDSDRIEEVFEDLHPPVRIKILKISNYFGCKLPSWLGSPLFYLRFLKITGCSNCKKLDGLGLLPFLEAFYIEGASSIKSIGPDFYTNNNTENGAYQNSVFFRSMKLLSFENMDNWEEWSSLGKDIRVMPCLEVLQIYACPKLKSFPEDVLFHAANYLKRIRICKATQLLLKKLHNLRFLEIIEIGNIPYLEKISGVPALQRL
ncbi:hypothetical protein IEQ34_013420 [Dendrobium chrysotoxum]|uniref:Disease resistance protein n=1 Tax=Dendrobium chrysotoxum TaxID=161865 RepID=A0AAV7GRP0_DENCH|nr:hypothetical protein IEQ34_013420 [Dendrobium chrysotoxum]